ncbi:MAG: hypothetical protein HY717_22580 [Planctomycetes bacterium]|nr:hypothetical protein [Planctomycetota bacterium]
MAKKVRFPENAGIPWMAILDADGKTLITSDGPKGNIGFPVEPHEIEHFLAMIRKTAKNLGADELSGLDQVLRETARKLKRP